jgi:hypothetical protein
MTSVVYLWSQYSPISASYLSFIQQKGGRAICIDHPAIRKQITSGGKFKVSEVPCILVSSQGKISQYEGSKAVQWIEYHQNQSSQYGQQSQQSQQYGQQSQQSSQYGQQSQQSQQYEQQSQQYEQQSQQYEQQSQQPSQLNFNMVPISDGARKQEMNGPPPAGGFTEGPGGLKFAMTSNMDRAVDDSEGPGEAPMISAPMVQIARGGMGQSQSQMGQQMGQYPPMGQQMGQSQPQMGQYPPMGQQMGQSQPQMGQYPPMGQQMGQSQPQMGQYPPMGQSQPQMGQYPQMGQPPPQDVTPISQIVAEPMQTSDRSQFSQNLGSYNQKAAEYYQQFQTPPQAPQIPSRTLSPKEQEFQRVLAMAKQDMQGTESSNEIMGSSS